jgi:hypothetical protein
MTLTSAVGASRASGNLKMTPGRWVAVALAVPVALALIGWTGFTLVSTLARGSYPFSYAVPVQGGQTTVDVNGGNVTLRQTPGGAARLTGTVQYGLVRPAITESSTAGGASVGISCDGIATDCGMNAVLEVPLTAGVTLSSNGGDVVIPRFAGGHLTLSTGGGNVDSSYLGGTLRIVTDGGDLTSTAMYGTMQVFTGGGNINAGDVGGTVRMETGGGDVTASSLAGTVQILTGGGNVNANGVSAQFINVMSGGGDVTLVFTQPPLNLMVTAAGGNITVVLPSGRTKYDILTPASDGGNVDVQSSLVSPGSPYTITAESGGGDVTITQGS